MKTYNTILQEKRGSGRITVHNNPNYEKDFEEIKGLVVIESDNKGARVVMHKGPLDVRRNKFPAQAMIGVEGQRVVIIR